MRFIIRCCSAVTVGYSQQSTSELFAVQLKHVSHKTSQPWADRPWFSQSTECYDLHFLPGVTLLQSSNYTTEQKTNLVNNMCCYQNSCLHFTMMHILWSSSLGLCLRIRLILSTFGLRYVPDNMFHNEKAISFKKKK